jgi:NitT/TauT family transport system substrate-binding protein
MLPSPIMPMRIALSLCRQRDAMKGPAALQPSPPSGARPLRHITVAMKLLAASLVVAAGLLAPGAGAADKIIAGTLGGQAPLWPFYIALNHGFFAAANIDLELNFAPSGSGVVQQLTARSVDVVVSTGMTEALQAIDKGAPLAVVRIIGDAAPYALVAKPTIRTIADLRGKTISTGGTVDITSIYFERMMTASGLGKGDYDVISAGVAAARYAALQAGAADAAMLLPPLNFHAAAAGYPTIALAADYANDFPFTGMLVHRAWAADHLELTRRLLAATNDAIAWFEDPVNRPAAVALLVAAARASPEDADASYDYLRKIGYFERTGKISRRRLGALIAIERGRGLVESGLTIDRLILPGLGELTD